MSLSCAIKILRNTHSLLVISGSGISQESGIPTYGGDDGLYQDESRILCLDDLRHNRYKVWSAVNTMRRLMYDKKPNRAHEILALWEKNAVFSHFLLATQNIDNLHSEAGSNRVCEIHGNVWKLAQKKSQLYTESQEFSDELLLVNHPEYREDILKKWSEENGYDVWSDKQIFAAIPPDFEDNVRPHIHFFDEPYNSKLLWVDDFAKRKVNTVLVIGCSGKVNVVHRIIQRVKEYNPSTEIIDINCQKNDVVADIHLRGKATEILQLLGENLGDL
ncbi:SIR2 family NAD-dependent protein deacylase [Candidatus Uabimicrobium amorphum]|uniref:protein acetyllysine N-acetyltransferase n=1 Tax=Uabimicrobium amorphum TaxID=2596890 RepID=A0A5S9IUZ0_UABAM|nr:Sir2 family NAD-dependent protein deacetylase [Candidatus Uabimicrobium amorphum]BBM87600.1 NAD-dependent protein deacylase [Candidatus Uabimicrobium amorphum]